MKRINSVVWGIALIAISVVLILNAFEITNLELFFDGWWTLFIIIPSLTGLFSGNDRAASLIGLAIGVFLLLAYQNVINFDIMWKLILPVIIAIIGFKMVLGGIVGKKEVSKIEKKPVIVCKQRLPYFREKI